MTFPPLLSSGSLRARRCTSILQGVWRHRNSSLGTPSTAASSKYVYLQWAVVSISFWEKCILTKVQKAHSKIVQLCSCWHGGARGGRGEQVHTPATFREGRGQQTIVIILNFFTELPSENCNFVNAVLLILLNTFF